MDLVWVHRSEVLAWFSGEMEWGSWKSFSELHQKGKRETKGEKERKNDGDQTKKWYLCVLGISGYETIFVERNLGKNLRKID